MHSVFTSDCYYDYNNIIIESNISLVYYHNKTPLHRTLWTRAHSDMSGSIILITF